MGLQEITEPMLAKAAGWEAMKSARQYVKSGAVKSATWKAPTASGLIHAGSLEYKAGLVFESEIDIENLCTCRQSRQYGTLCAHSVAIVLATLHPESMGTKSRAPETPKTHSTISDTHKAEAKAPPIKPWFNHDDSANKTLSLRFILAPNTVSQFHPKSISLMMEGSDGGAFKPLNSLDRTKSYRIEDGDQHTLKFLQQHGVENPTPMLNLKSENFCELLELLSGTERLSLGRSRTVSISEKAWVPPLKITLEPEGTLSVSLNGQNAPEGMFSGQPGYVWLNGQFQPIGIPQSMMSTLQAPMKIERLQVPIFLHQLEQIPTTEHPVEMNFSFSDFQITSGQPELRLCLEGGLARLDAKIQATYGTQRFFLSKEASPQQFCDPDPKHSMHYVLRDPAAEQQALDELRRAGFKPDGKGERWRLTGQDPVLTFLCGPYQRLRKDWEIKMDERLDGSYQRNIETVQPEVSMNQSSGDWFDFSVKYSTSDGTTLPQDEISRLLRSGKSYSRKPNGKFLVLDAGAIEEFEEVLIDCNPQQQHGQYRARKSQAAFLEGTFEQSNWKVQRNETSKKHQTVSTRELINSFKEHLPSLAEKLRPYQWQGVAWMQDLFQRNFAGILADEMGLGKTLQVLTWINWKKKQAHPMSPVLVICPSSLVFNWTEEAARWTPDLKALPLEGPQRAKRFREICRHDLVITSYALIRRDAAQYRHQVFEAVILDEAQHIKNRATQNAQSVKSIKANHRLVLTGTPMENSVLDLWSIFDFLMPGYLGSARDFKDRYEAPITQQKTSPILDRLKRRVGPFLLRRTKTEVRPDLPDRIDQVAYCELSKEQRSIYQQVMETGRAKLLEISEQKQASGQARMMVLSSILRMRQICCDARLLDIEEDQLKQPSSKLELFTELLDEALDGGHRILVFSQFVKMLSIIRKTLETREVDFCYLDGSTTQRGKVVQRFQNSQIPVFLISLKAGGTGLNLTGADTVVHFDPWWNPAIEAQATARAHRIGQTQTVTSYKLVARDTIEEKILTLQQRKQAQLDAMLESGIIDGMDGLNWEEIESLLE
jgi:superfamily II DNA or RNA helicase